LKYFGSNLEEAGQILYLGSQGLYGKDASSLPVQTNPVAAPESPSSSHLSTLFASMPSASQHTVTLSDSVVNKKVVESKNEDGGVDAHGLLCEALVGN
jgi:hypothetical protein